MRAFTRTLPIRAASAHVYQIQLASPVSRRTIMQIEGETWVLELICNNMPYEMRSSQSILELPLPRRYQDPNTTVLY